MNANEIKRRLNEKPFLPFEVVVSSGERYAIRHPENAHLVTGGILYIFTPVDDEDADFAFPPVSVSVMHVTSLDPLPEKAA